MQEFDSNRSIKDNIQAAMQLPKCRRCGCMEETLEIIMKELLNTGDKEILNNSQESVSDLLKEVTAAIKKVESIEYS